VDLYANNTFNTKYATGGGTSRNHSTSLGFVEDALHTGGVPCKSTGSTCGSGFEGQLPPTMHGASTENASKIIPALALIAIHLSGSNGVDCALYGVDQSVDFKTLQGLSHYNNTSTTPGVTLEKRQKAVNKEHHDRTKKLDSELHGTQQDQRGSIGSQLNEYGYNGRVLALVIGR